MPFFEVEGMRLHALEAGAGSTVLLLHAFPLSSEMWRPQIDALAAQHRILAPDVRGFGASSDGAGALSMETIARDYEALLDVVGVGRAVVCGLSMGGYIAFELVRRAPKRVAGLVLADTRAGADTDEGRSAREALAQAVVERGTQWLVDEVTPKMLGPTAAPAVVQRVRALVGANRPEAVAAGLRAMARRSDSFDLLPTITCPTLVLVGAEDRLTPPEEAEAIASRIPSARMRVLAGAGHLSNLEAASAFSAELSAFVARVLP